MKQSEAKSQYKVCVVCGISRSLDRYPNDSKYPDGHRNKCKDCNNKEIKIRRELNLNGFREMANNRLKKHRRTPRGAMRQRFQAAQRRAKEVNVPFDITLDFLMDLYVKQDGKCALTGLPLKFIGDFWEVLSLDRIIPEEGYTKSNVQLVINRINMMKNNMSMDELINFCKLIIEKGSETIS